MSSPFARCILMLVSMSALGCQEAVTAGPTKADFAAERNRLAKQAAAGPPERVAPVDAARAAWVGNDSASDGARRYGYSAKARRDPFRSVLFEMSQAAEAAPRAPLEQFDLGQISVLAVIWDAVNPRALILDPSGRSFVIQKGSRIGKNSGRVVDIGDSVVMVRETYANYAGQHMTKDIAMRIRGSQGG